jgi:hypothetical protein
MYGTIDPGSCIQRVHGFGIRTRYDTCVTESLHRVDYFYHGMLILCQSHHDVHACIPDQATILGGDGTGSIT